MEAEEGAESPWRCVRIGPAPAAVGSSSSRPRLRLPLLRVHQDGLMSGQAGTRGTAASRAAVGVGVAAGGGELRRRWRG